MVSMALLVGRKAGLLVCLLIGVVIGVQAYMPDDEQTFSRQSRLIPDYQQPTSGSQGVKPVTVARQEFLKQLIGYLSLVGRKK